MAKTDLTKKLLTRFGRLKGQRQNWETHWQEVADYMMPRKSDVTKKRTRGDKRMELIFDSSPLQALELLAASPTRAEVSQATTTSMDGYDSRKTKARGRSMTIMTGPRGIEDETLTLGRKSLLGQ